MRVLKRRIFERWQRSEGFSDAALCKAIKEMESGLIDANLGGGLYKKRLARVGSGKRGSYRTVLAARIGVRYVFLHGFSKNAVADITQKEKRALQFAGEVFLDLDGVELAQALQAGVLQEVNCDQSYH